MKEINEDAYNQAVLMVPWLRKYSVFSKAKKIGLQFNASEIDIETLEHFFIVEQVINKWQQTTSSN